MHYVDWISDNLVEIFGAVTGILYVILEVKQKLWLWPVGIITSAVYIWIFFHGKLYADMSLQCYYLVISILGWYWWLRGSGPPPLLPDGSSGGRSSVQDEVHSANSSPLDGGESFQMKSPLERDEGGVSSSKDTLKITRLNTKSGFILVIVFVILYVVMWQILSRLTDSPVPQWDSFITTLSVIATWMLARKIYEHWYLWIVVNISASVLFFTRGLYPTVILYIIYCAMSFVGLFEWKRSMAENLKTVKSNV